MKREGERDRERKRETKNNRIVAEWHTANDTHETCHIFATCIDVTAKIYF